MNTTSHSYTLLATARPCRRQTRALSHRRRQGFTPRVVLHVLVGALTLVALQALLKPIARAWSDNTSVTVVYAEQGTASPGLSAPALSTGAATAPAQTVRQDPAHGDVLTELGASIGRSAAPVVTTWQGIAGQQVYRRAQPNRSKPPVGTLEAGTPVEVVDWVPGEEVEPRNDTWAKLADGTFVYSTSLRRTGSTDPGPIPANAPTNGRWIDVDLTRQLATAYDGTTPLRTALVSTGQPGWDTPIGTFPVLRRLEKDTMDGTTLIGQGPNGAGSDYKVEDVRYVQYFTNDGAAIHENYWRRPATFGMPGSHGCIGMLAADALWFWNFATVGTPLVIHE